MNNYKEVFQLAQDKGYKPAFFKTENHWQDSPESFNRMLLLESTLIQKWLRDEQDITVLIDYGFVAKWDVQGDVQYTSKEYPTYEAALLEGIHQALKLIP
jgi:hypothetical protein